MRSEYSANLRKVHLEGILMEKRIKLLGSAYTPKPSQKPGELYDKLFQTAARHPAQLTPELIEILQEIKNYSAKPQNHSTEFFSTFISPDFIRMSMEGFGLGNDDKQNIDAKVEFIWIWCNLTVTDDLQLLADVWESGLVEAVVDMMERSIKHCGLIEDGYLFLKHMLHQHSPKAQERFAVGHFDDRLASVFERYYQDNRAKEDLEFYSSFIMTLIMYKPYFRLEQIEKLYRHLLHLITGLKDCSDPGSLMDILVLLQHYLAGQNKHGLTLACMVNTPLNLIGLLKRHEFRDIQNIVARILTRLCYSEKADSMAEVRADSPRTC